MKSNYEGFEMEIVAYTTEDLMTDINNGSIPQENTGPDGGF